jgi:hypothetical protein
MEIYQTTSWGLVLCLRYGIFLTRRFGYDVYGLGYVWIQVVVAFQLINHISSFSPSSPTRTSAKMGTATMKTVSKKPFYLQTGNPISHLSMSPFYLSCRDRADE